MDIQIKQ